MELEESGSLTSDYTTRLDESKQYDTDSKKPRNTDQKNSTENPKICPCTYSQLIYVKEAKEYNGEKTISSISSAGKTGQLQARE